MRPLWRAFVAFWTSAEFVAGAILVSVLSMVVPTIFLLGVIDRDEPGSVRILAAVVFCVTVLLGGYCMVLAFGPVFAGESWGPALAARQPRWPFPIRPILALYWLAHFLLGAAFAVAAELFGYGSAGPTTTVGRLLLAAAAFALTLAANFYLLLSISTFTRSEKVVHGVWRLRLVIDLIIIVVAIVLGKVAD